MEKDLTCKPAELSESDLHSREAAFHDAWASDTELSDILVRECFEAPTAMENQFILRRMGDLRGKKLLDIGAGLGESSVYFALQGAEVTTVDLSPQMVETALKLGARYGVKLRGLVSGGETLDLPQSAYDIIYIANTIHHVQDRASLFAQMQRALKPGGRFFSYDPLAYNPAINVYRRMATGVRTPDESPLTAADIAAGKEIFSKCGAPGILGVVAAAVCEVLRERPCESKRRPLLEENSARNTKTLWWWLPLRSVDRIAGAYSAGAVAGVEHGDVGRKGRGINGIFDRDRNRSQAARPPLRRVSREREGIFCGWPFPSRR